MAESGNKKGTRRVENIYAALIVLMGRVARFELLVGDAGNQFRILGG